MQIAVIGGANIDLMAKCRHGFKLHDSNIANIETSHGGVGRNIVHNCALLGLECSFYSAVGDDDYAKALINKLQSLGVDTKGVRLRQGYSTGMYISFIDETGDMVCAVNDMQVIDLITPDVLKECAISEELIAFDANLKPETIEYLINSDSIVFAEPVSVAKGIKLKPYLDKIDIIKPNIYEAEMLSDVKISCENDIIEAGKNSSKGELRKYLSRQGKRACMRSARMNTYILCQSRLMPLMQRVQEMRSPQVYCTALSRGTIWKRLVVLLLNVP